MQVLLINSKYAIFYETCTFWQIILLNNAHECLYFFDNFIKTSDNFL